MSDFLPAGYRFSTVTILRILGSGGFANTYLACDQQGKALVVKELFPRGVVLREEGFAVRVDPRHEENYSFWESSIEGFQDEIKVLNALSLPTVPRLVDAFQANNTFYLVQDFVDGDPLSQRVEAFQLLAPQDRVCFSERLLTTLLQTLSVLHDCGVLHRDIKPSNIIIRSDTGAPVLIDFGGVRFQVGGITYNFHKRVGSEGYCSFEQVTDGVEQNESSDLYALAATMYSLLFAFEPPDCLKRLKEETAFSFVSLVKNGYSQRFLRSLDMAFRLDKKDRFQSAEEWLAELSGEGEEVPLTTWFIGRDPTPETCSVISNQAPSISRKYIDGEYISRLHLQVNRYANSWQLINHSVNGSWLVNDDGSSTPIIDAIHIANPQIQIDLAGQIYLLSDLIDSMSE